MSQRGANTTWLLRASHDLSLSAAILLVNLDSPVEFRYVQRESDGHPLDEHQFHKSTLPHRC